MQTTAEQLQHWLAEPEGVRRKERVVHIVGATKVARLFPGVEPADCNFAGALS